MVSRLAHLRFVAVISFFLRIVLRYLCSPKLHKSITSSVIAFGTGLAMSGAAWAEKVQAHLHGTGSVSFNVGTNTCDANCTEVVNGTEVTVTANPGNATTVWEGDCDNVNGNVCTVKADTDKSIHAYFVYPVTVARAGSGKGTVVSGASEINCGPKCSAPIKAGRTITLTVVPDSRSRFERWVGGDCTDPSMTRCTVAANAARSITARFLSNNMDVSIGGTGRGRVTSVPSGINCGRICSQHVTSQSVSLTATPGPHSRFDGWQGACTGTANPCVLNLSDVGDVQANFAPKTLSVLLQGLGVGTVTAASPLAFTCTSAGNVQTTACSLDVNNSATDVVLTATAGSNSTFAGWRGDCDATAVAASNSNAQVQTNTCTVRADRVRKVRALFDKVDSVPALKDYSRPGPNGFSDGLELSFAKIKAFLEDHPSIDTVPKFIAKLPQGHLENWIMMPRSESLQTGTAKHPRLILSDALGKFIFTVTLAEDPSYPGSHRNVVEFMEWHQTTRNFRLHEIVLPNNIAAMDGVPARSRGVTEDDTKCAFCHSTGNVPNSSPFAGTDGVGRAAGFKSKPNWDTYDSWAGMLPFNRDRIYRGSIEHNALTTILNPWTWRDNIHARRIIELLSLQPAMVTSDQQHSSRLTRQQGGVRDGELILGAGITEPAQQLTTNYSFNNRPGRGASTNITAAGNMVRLLHNSDQRRATDEGRGVNLFDILGGLQGESMLIGGQSIKAPLNARRIADELIRHRVATGNVVNVDVRPVALAIIKGCISATNMPGNLAGFPTNPSTNPFQSVGVSLQPSVASFDADFFNARHGVSAFNELVFDTYKRQIDLPRRKADLQRLTLDRREPIENIVDMGRDDRLLKSQDTSQGLFQEYDPTIGWDSVPQMQQLRAAVFQRSGLATGDSSGGRKDRSVMQGAYIDREVYFQTTAKMALFRYFLEPLGVPVDRWAPNVRNRSAAYTFADVFNSNQSAIRALLEESIKARAYGSAQPPANPATAVQCSALMANVDDLFGHPGLQDADDVPTFTDVQRIFNKACIACHNDMNLMPVANFDYLTRASDGSLQHPSCRFNLAEDTDADGNPGNDKYGPRPVANCGYNPGNGTYIREERLTRPHYWASTRTVPAGNTPAQRMKALHDSSLYQRILGPDHPDLKPTNRPIGDMHHTWEHCGTYGGQMPCGGPALPAADVQTIRRWILGGTPYTLGDPHIRTIDGTNYDFQAAGEYTYLRDPGFELQVRHMPHETAAPLGPNPHTGLTSCVSLVGAVAVQTGRHRITYQPDGLTVQGTKRLRIDGKVVEMPTRELALSNGARIIRVGSGFRMDIPDGTSFEVRPFWGDYLSVRFKSTRATEGLGGKISGNQWLPQLRDGSFLGPRPKSFAQRYEDLYSAFGRSWAVTDANSLFDYETGTSPASFQLADWPRGHKPASCELPPTHPANIGTPLDALQPEQAEQACAGLADTDLRAHCVADTAALGDIEVAQAYLDVAAAIQHREPLAPVLITPANFETRPAESLNLRWDPSVDDANNVTYRACLWNAKDAFSFEACEQPRFSSGVYLAGGASGTADIGIHDASIPWYVFGLLLLALVLLIVALRQKSLLIALIALLLIIIAGWLWISQQSIHAEPPAPGLTYTPTGLASGETYYWRVLTEDQSGGLSVSETRTLIIQ